MSSFKTGLDGESSEYAGTVKRHNVCKRYISIDTGFNQTGHAIFLHFMG